MSINVNSTEINTSLQLYPMAISGAETNVLPPGAYHLGIPLSIHSPSTALYMVIDPVTALSTTLALGDSVRLWVNGQATAVIKVIKPGEENQRMAMELPWGWLVNGANTLFYRVTRISGNVEDSTPILNVLFNNPATGITVSHPASIGPGQPATFTFTRNYPREYDVVTLSVGTWSKTVPYTHPANPISYTLTSADLQQIGDGTHSVSATVVDQLSNRNLSPTTSIIISANTLVLPPPTVNGQSGSNFSPTTPEVRVLVPQGSLLPADKVSVVWQGAAGSPAAGSYTSPQRLVSAGLEIAVPRSVLAYSLGKPVTVTYIIERNGVTSTSPPLLLNILPLPETALIAPKILEADANNVLDVLALGTKNATIHTLLHTLIESGQPCWLSLEGKKTDGTQHNLSLWNGLPAQVNATWISQGFWPAALSNSYLKQLGHGTPLTIKFKVSMDKSNNAATAVVFADRIYTIKASAVAITALTDSTGTSVSNGGSTFQTGVTLTGTAGPNQQVQVLLNGTARQTVTANANGIWSYSISGLAVFFHTFIARPMPAGAPDSAPWRVNVVSEWVDDYTDFQNGSYNGWIPHNAARSGYIRIHAGVQAFFNFTDLGAIKGFAGTVLYKDFACLPGTYSFRMQACHVPDSYTTGIPNPIMQLQCGISGGDGAVREVPKNGTWYDFKLDISVPARRIVRFYIQNHQDNGYGNDFGIRNISVIRSSGGAGAIMESLEEAPLYNGPPLPALPRV